MDIFTRLLVLVPLLFCSVNCQDPVVPGFLGGNVTLPCSFDKSLSKTDKVFWRDRDDFIVLDIIGGEPKSDNNTYKGRVSIIPDNFKNGNVAIIMRNLKLEDAGPYRCRLLPDRVIKKVNLTVSDKPAVKTTDPSDGAAGTKVLSVALLSTLSLLLCF